jgi:hypothetical protein
MAHPAQPDNGVPSGAGRLRETLRLDNEPVVPSSDASPQSSTWVIALEVMFHA